VPEERLGKAVLSIPGQVAGRHTPANEPLDEQLRVLSVGDGAGSAVVVGADAAPGPYQGDVAKQVRLDSEPITLQANMDNMHIFDGATGLNILHPAQELAGVA
jgi:hypothetical protein